MNATQTAAAETASSNDTSDELTPLDANNFIRSQDYGCLLITDTSNAEPIQTAFITVKRSYFRINQFGRTQQERIASVERHTMSDALKTAQENGDDVQLAAYSQSDIDIEADIDFIRNNFELDDKSSSASFGLTREQLDEADDNPLEIASSPADTSEEHGGGWD